MAIWVAGALGLSLLIGEQGLARSIAVRRIAATPRSLARWLIGGVLLAAVLAALSHLAHPAIDHRVAALIGIIPALLVQVLVLRRAHGSLTPMAIRWLLPCSLLPMLATMTFAHDARSSLQSGLLVALALAIGLPAFSALAQRLDDADVPAWMRPLPTRLLATGVIVLAMAGSLPW
ncbi:MAG TPA: hypothetical protein VFN29_03230 [Chiayiivirga sp.]|nr:hypothetical protein [Chiayiivirga sp.]